MRAAFELVQRLDRPCLLCVEIGNNIWTTDLCVFSPRIPLFTLFSQSKPNPLHRSRCRNYEPSSYVLPGSFHVIRMKAYILHQRLPSQPLRRLLLLDHQLIERQGKARPLFRCATTPPRSIISRDIPHNVRCFRQASHFTHEIPALIVSFRTFAHGSLLPRTHAFNRV